VRKTPKCVKQATQTGDTKRGARVKEANLRNRAANLRGKSLYGHTREKFSVRGEWHREDRRRLVYASVLLDGGRESIQGGPEREKGKSNKICQGGAAHKRKRGAKRSEILERQQKGGQDARQYDGAAELIAWPTRQPSTKSENIIRARPRPKSLFATKKENSGPGQRKESVKHRGSTVFLKREWPCQKTGNTVGVEKQGAQQRPPSRG